MSINSTNRKAGPYACNGATVAFPFVFKVLDQADVRVVLADTYGAESDLVLTTDYSVALNADQDANPGGTVTALSAYPSGYTITLTSNLALLQPVTLTNAGGFYPAVINKALDRLTILIQQISERVDRSLKVPISSAASATADVLIALINSAASSATASAATATTKATAAANSATAASGSATASANSATAAANSATAASNSATTAASAVSAALVPATTSVAGISKLATGSEAYTDSTAVLTQAALRTALQAGGAAPIYAVRAYIAFSGSTLAYAGSNIASMTDLGVGKWGVNFSTAMASNTYGVAPSARSTNTSGGAATAVMMSGTTIRTASWCDIWCMYVSSGDQAFVDADISVSFIGG